MFNQVKAEIYKLFKGKAIYVIFILIAILLFSATKGNEIVFGGYTESSFDSVSGIATSDTPETIYGFTTGHYHDKENPQFMEIARSSIGQTWAFIFISLVFTLNFYCREYKENTLKIAVACGNSRVKIFLSKFFVLTTITALLYNAFTFLSFFIEIRILNFPFNLDEFFKFIELSLYSTLLLISLTSLVLLFSVIIQNAGVISAVLCIALFAPLFLNFMYISDPEGINLAIKLFLFSNPMFYWLEVGAANMTAASIKILLTYCGFSTLSCLGLSICILYKQELK